MSFIKLPQEVLDQVCEEVGTFGARDAVKTLLSLSLISRSSLPSARRELYCNPMRDNLVNDNLPAANLLLHTLLNSPHLTPLVRHLDDFGLATHQWKSIFTVEKQPQDWDERLIAMCPHLKSVGVYVNSVDRAQHLPDLVAQLSSLDRLVLNVDTYQGHPRILLSIWNRTYVSLAPAWRPPRLVLRPASLGKASLNPQPDVPPDAAVTDLTFVLSFGTSAFGERYDASLQQLTSLSIQATGEFDVAPLSPLVVAASGGHLRSFSYEGETLEPDIVDASGWEELNLDKLSMPDVLFTSFPSVTSFTSHGRAG